MTSEPAAEAAVQSRAVFYCAYAAFAVLVYDHLLTFGEETTRIWPSRMSLAKVLFLVNRYFTPLGIAFQLIEISSTLFSAPHICKHVARLEPTIWLIISLVAGCVMMLRIYALWGRNRLILAILGLLWTFHLVASAVNIHREPAAPPIPGLTGCIPEGTGDGFDKLIFWLPVILDSVVFGLTLWRTKESFKGGIRQTPTVQLFLQDGALYFFFISAVNTFSATMDVAGPLPLRPIGAVPSSATTGLMISRLLLNLRGPRTKDNSAVRGWNDDVVVGSLGTHPEFAFGNTSKAQRQEGILIPSNEVYQLTDFEHHM